jgi:predicted nucleic-acid-binding Zn-ribbon protein
VIAYSCTPLSCFEGTEAFVKASFVNNSITKLQPPDSLTIYGLNNESVKLYNKAANVQPAHLPLNSSAENCTFIVRINGVSDTVEIKYTSYPHLISKECGVTFFHKIDTIIHTKNIIDYIYITRGNITTVNEENIRIFY